MRVSEKGQVTIPGRIRRNAGFLPGTDVEFVEDEAGVHLRKAAGGKKGSQREREVADALDRLRGSAAIALTTEQIMALTRGR